MSGVVYEVTERITKLLVVSSCKSSARENASVVPICLKYAKSFNVPASLKRINVFVLFALSTFASQLPYEAGSVELFNINVFANTFPETSSS